MKHFKIKVEGIVQGVRYRKSTQEQANKLNLKGYVKNEADGSVLVEVEGSKKMLELFVLWCKVGPERATVESVKVSEGQINNYPTFEIKY